jgi:polysaccharide export outer membrane protein
MRSAVIVHLVRWLLMLAPVMGCATERPFVWIQDLPVAPAPHSGPEVIHSRDTIVVTVRDQPTLSGELVVRDDGGCVLPTLGDIRVDGRAPQEIAAELRARLKNVIVNAEVTVSVSRVAPIRVSVVGEVKSPGLYELGRDRTVAAALAIAGWVTDFAAKDRVFVVRRGSDELRVRFRIAEITTPDPSVGRFRLRDGDVVVVE